MKRIALNVAVLCAALFTCSVFCIAQDINYNYAPGTDFSKYKTYKWVDVPGAQYPDQLTSNQIKQAALDILGGRYNLETTREAISLNVLNAFLQVLYAEELVKNSKKQI